MSEIKTCGCEHHKHNDACYHEEPYVGNHGYESSIKTRHCPRSEGVDKSKCILPAAIEKIRALRAEAYKKLETGFDPKYEKMRIITYDECLAALGVCV